MSRHLRHLHSAAIRLVERGSNALTDKEAAHGLEQQLIEAVVDCLATGPAIDIPPATCERQDVALRFEALLQAQPERSFRMPEICAALGISARTLHLSCDEQLGMGPAEYVRRRRMQLVHRALRRKNPDKTTISAVARHYGFRSLGHFAADYHALYGELPTATLRRGSGHGIARLNLRNTRRRA
jgi:AraC family ethanolamine operon transcriptional activator